MQRRLKQLQASAAEPSKIAFNLPKHLIQLLQPLIQFRSIIVQRPTHDPLNVWPAMCTSLLKVPLYAAECAEADTSNAPHNLRLLTEVIATQALPAKLARFGNLPPLRAGRVIPHLRKGEKGSLIVYSNTTTRTETDPETGAEEEQSIPFVKGRRTAPNLLWATLTT